MYYETKKQTSFTMALILIFLVVITVILITLVQKIERSSALSKTENIELTGTDTVLTDFNLQDLVKNASYSIVGVSKLNEKNTSIFVENSEEKLGIGSGIILSSNGLILSNYETTGGIGETCYVTLKNGSIYPADVKWSNQDLDISIIKIAADNLLYLAMGESNQISIGDKYYLLSNATGYDFGESLTDILIQKNQTTLKTYNETTTSYAEDVIKINRNIDHEINGGALLNEKGEVLGIASSKINAIIPINRIKPLIANLKENENYKAPYLGIYGFDATSLKYLAPDYPLTIGIYVDKIAENSPTSGQLSEGDIITKIDDYELSTFQDLSIYLTQKSPKQKVTLTAIRGTKELTITTILK